MANENPVLNEKPQAWYQGLTRYHWFLLIVASMGWMFDTMDQQFFNLARGPALTYLHRFDPVREGKEKVGEDRVREYAAGDLDGLVSSGLLTASQKDALLKDADGKPRSVIPAREVLRAVGETALVPKFVGLGAGRLAENNVNEESFDAAAVNALVAKNLISADTARKQIADHSSGTIPRSDLALYMGREIAKARIDSAGDTATMIFVLGWAIGGLFFGYVGDALGRAKTMALTILTYALFTGLVSLAQTEFQFRLFLFLNALGVGGEFAAGAALIAESMPDRSRPAALGALQALSAGGNMAAAALSFFIMPLFGWRWLFAVGALPAVVAVFAFLALKEPEKWKQARAKWLEQKSRGVAPPSSYVGLFADNRWRKRVIVGMLMGVVGVGGLWGVGFFTPELVSNICKGMTDATKERHKAATFFLQQFGAFLGIVTYTWISVRVGRKPAFAVFFILAFFVVGGTFLKANTLLQAYILLPMVGFVTLGPFGGYAIYFPELFPTRLRASGAGFCYNVGRFLAAPLPQMKSGLKGLFMSGALALPLLPAATGNADLAIRYGSFLMIFIYIVGLFVLLFAPETKGQPLPEE